MFRAVVLLCCLGACDAPLTSRQATIVQTLVDTDRDLANLRPERIAEKYVAMGANIQAFLRGTLAVFFRDMTRFTGTNELVHGAPGELVQLYGDLHLENVGATFDSSGMLWDCVDFDATVEGPFAWDVRRAALALHAALVLANRPDAEVDAAVAAIAEGYSKGLTGPDAPLRKGAVGRIADALLDDAETRQREREDLSRYTTVSGGERRLQRNGDLVDLDADGDGNNDGVQPDFALLLEGYRQSRRTPVDRETLAIKDVADRRNAGVASVANLRYYVLVEGPPGVDDDLILELKEQRDPPEPIALLGRGPVGTPFENAARAVEGALILQSSNTMDPDLGYTRGDSVSYQVRSVSRGRRDLDVADLGADLRAGKFGADDIRALGIAIGELMGRGHARSLRSKNISVADVVALLPSDFSARITNDARADHDVLRSDLDLFRDALEKRGPLLRGDFR